MTLTVPVSDGTRIGLGTAAWALLTTALTILVTTDGPNKNIGILLLFVGAGLFVIQNFTRFRSQDNDTQKRW